MISSTPRVILRLTGLVFLLCSYSTSAQAFVGSMGLDPSDLSINHLTIQSDSGGGSTNLAFETTGVILADRIELRLAAGLDFSPITTPPDWLMQTTLVSESGISLQIVTYYYTGNDVEDLAEFFDFAIPWEIVFRINDPTPGAAGIDPLTTAVSVEVYAHSFIPELGLISVSDSFSLAATLTSAQTQQPFSFSVEEINPAGPTLRFNTALPGIVYNVQFTEDLQSWSYRTEFSTLSVLSDYPLQLDGEWKLREFFRLFLTPLPPNEGEEVAAAFVAKELTTIENHEIEDAAPLNQKALRKGVECIRGFREHGRTPGDAADFYLNHLQANEKSGFGHGIGRGGGALQGTGGKKSPLHR